MAQILQFKAKEELGLTSDKVTYITQEMIEGYDTEMFVFYEDNKQIGAATSLNFLRVCYSDRGAETAPFIGA